MTLRGTVTINALRNILQQRILLLIFISSLATALFFPLRSYFIVLPFFGEKLLDYTEEEARKTARYLVEEMIYIEGGKLALSPLVDAQASEAMSNFGLEKIKIFNSVGKIIYSSDVKDIGTINQCRFSQTDPFKISRIFT